MDELRKRLAAALAANDQGGHTSPDPSAPMRLDGWDSACAAIGWAHLDMRRALDELESLFAGQRPDGRVPRSRAIAGPAPEGHDDVAAPLAPTAALRMIGLGLDPRGMAHLITAFDRSLAYFATARDPLQLDLVVMTPDDGSPPLYDPGLTALVAKAEHDLALIAELVGATDVLARAGTRARRLQSSLQARLWDPTLGRFLQQSVDGPVAIAPQASAWLPLILPLDANYRDRLGASCRRELDATWPLRGGTRAYGGATRVDLNWLLTRPLGRQLADRTLQMVERFDVYQSYDPDEGTGHGAYEHAATAALALDLSLTRKDG